MKWCWARSQGGCSETFSREHVISRGAWTEGMVTLQGLECHGGGRRTLKTSKLTAHVLCSHHNNALSPLDQEATRLAHALRGLAKSNERKSVTLDGRLYERWCLNVMLNLCSSGWTKITKPVPHPKVVEVVFGERHLEDGAGIYCLKKCCYLGTDADQYAWDVLVDSETKRRVVGLVLNFQGLLTVFWMLKGSPEHLLRSMPPGPMADFTDAEFWYRPKQIKIDKEGTSAGLDITFVW